jgi:hypothetical protein
MSRRLCLRAFGLALLLLSAGGAVARADDGREPVPTGTGRPPAPPQSELRPSDIKIAPLPTIAVDVRRFLSPVPIAPRRKELVLFVGGYGSRNDDGAFDVLKGRFPADSYDVMRLGDDPEFRYDTYGSVDGNARVLTDQIRRVSSGYAGVNIVSHSMGGVVVDRAIANGLSAADGVRTYVALASPHSGSDYARAPVTVLPLIAPVRDIVRAGGVAAARDPDSPAIHDLARARPVGPAAGIVRVDASLATDGLVNEFDARDPNIPQRLYLPATAREAIDGHGGSLVNREIADLVVETVRTHAVPPDRRDIMTRALAPILWSHETMLWRALLLGLTCAAIGLFALRCIPGCQAPIDQLNALCRRFIRAKGR